MKKIVVILWISCITFGSLVGLAVAQTTKTSPTNRLIIIGKADKASTPILLEGDAVSVLDPSTTFAGMPTTTFEGIPMAGSAGRQQVTATPEPSTLLLLGLGVLILLKYSRKMKGPMLGLMVGAFVGLLVLCGSAQPVAAQSEYFGYLEYGGSWYDVNKVWDGSDDDLCWAAAASNILAWSGWGTEVFDTANEIYDTFRTSWTDAANTTEYAWNWWFDVATKEPLGDGDTWATVETTSEGGYWAAQNFFESYLEWGAVNTMEAITTSLHDGYGVTVRIYETTEMTGHALTTWGYEYDPSGMATGLWVTDSDDASAELVLLPVAYDQANAQWSLGGEYSGWSIGGVNALKRQQSSYFAATYGGATLDAASCIQQTQEGGYIVAGVTTSFGAGGQDVWVLKLDKSGAVSWQFTYGGSDDEQASFIQQTADDGYIVAGVTKSVELGHQDVWVLKLDSSGTVLWQKVYGDLYYDDAAYAIHQTADGGYIVAAGSKSFSDGIEDIWVLKLDSTGNVDWQKTYGEADYADIPYAVQQTTDGGYIVAGVTRSFYYGVADAWVLKLDSTGEMIWQKVYGDLYYEDAAYAIHPTTDGGYIVAGMTTSFGAGNDDVWVLKLDGNGTVIWQKTYGGKGDERAYAIRQTADTGYIVTGMTTSFGAGNDDVWVLKLDGNGTVIWQKAYGGTDYDEAHFVQQTKDSGYVFAGKTGSFGAGSDDIWILKLNEDGNLAERSLGTPTTAVAMNTTAIVGTMDIVPTITETIPRPSALVAAATTVAPEYLVDQVTITAIAGPRGSLSPEGFIPVAGGNSQSVTITPDPGYSLLEVWVDGVNEIADCEKPRRGNCTQPTADSFRYTFANLNADHTIEAVFLPASETVTIHAGSGNISKRTQTNPGGSIWPVGEVQVEQGSSQTFTITPAYGYRVANLVVDGESLGAITEYTFEDVTEHHEIRAEFVTVSEHLVFIRKTCLLIDEVTNTLQEIACGTVVDGTVVDGTLMIDGEECGTGCLGDVASFTSLSGVILDAVPNAGTTFVQWQTADGETVEGIVYTEQDIVIQAVIGHCRD